MEVVAFDRDRIGNLAEPATPISPDTICGDLYDRFSAEPDLMTVPVVQDGYPVGLINRNQFCLRLADKFGRPLFEKKPVTHLMDQDPLIADAGVLLDDLTSWIVRDRPSALMDGFIVTLNGAYFGVGTAFSMLRMRMELTQIRADELEVARGVAESASKAKSDFLANMSHELRTPLNAVIGFSDIMAREVFGPLGNVRYQEYAADIHRSGGHLLQLVNDILDLSKIEAGKLELALGRVSLVDLIQSAVRMTSDRARLCDIDIKIVLEEEIGEIEADRTKILQILLNLLSNSVKFTPAGGRVQVIGRSIGPSSIGLEVNDDGIGMTAEELALALEPFGQVESGNARRYDGTGLGLPLTKSIVELHGGTFRIYSTKGQGTRVIVKLPVSQPMAQPRKDLQSAQALRA